MADEILLGSLSFNDTPAMESLRKVEAATRREADRFAFQQTRKADAAERFYARAAASAEQSLRREITANQTAANRIVALREEASRRILAGIRAEAAEAERIRQRSLSSGGGPGGGAPAEAGGASVRGRGRQAITGLRQLAFFIPGEAGAAAAETLLLASAVRTLAIALGSLFAPAIAAAAAGFAAYLLLTKQAREETAKLRKETEFFSAGQAKRTEARIQRDTLTDEIQLTRGDISQREFDRRALFRSGFTEEGQAEEIADLMQEKRTADAEVKQRDLIQKRRTEAHDAMVKEFNERERLQNKAADEARDLEIELSEISRRRALDQKRFDHERSVRARDAARQFAIDVGAAKPSDFITDPDEKRRALFRERLADAEGKGSPGGVFSQFQKRSGDLFSGSTIFGESRLEPLKETNRILEEIRDELKRDIAAGRLN